LSLCYTKESPADIRVVPQLESFALTAPLSPPRLPQGGLSSPSFSALPPPVNGNAVDMNGLVNGNGTGPSPAATPFVKAVDEPLSPSLVARGEAVAKGYSQRVILTTYPGQVGINPIPLEWGASTPEARGPVVASRQPKSLKIRNAIGAYAGSYSVYKALTSAAGLMDPNHRPGEFLRSFPHFSSVTFRAVCRDSYSLWFYPSSSRRLK
jgi:hypothetical protein